MGAVRFSPLQSALRCKFPHGKWMASILKRLFARSQCSLYCKTNQHSSFIISIVCAFLSCPLYLSIARLCAIFRFVFEFHQPAILILKMYKYSISSSVACLFIVLSLQSWATDGRAVVPADNNDSRAKYNGIQQLNSGSSDNSIVARKPIDSNGMWFDAATLANNSIRTSAKSNTSKNDIERIRRRRQFDFTIDADHEDGLGTDLMAAATANLYKDERTRLDATARYKQHFSEMAGPGKAKIGGSLHFSHQYW